jgi:hypothetical protein
VSTTSTSPTDAGGYRVRRPSVIWGNTPDETKRTIRVITRTASCGRTAKQKRASSARGKTPPRRRSEASDRRRRVSRKISMTGNSNDEAVKTRLRVVGLLVIAYFFLAAGWLTFSGRIGWHSVSAAVFILTPLALWSMWHGRSRFTESEWRLLYLPLVIWLVSFFLFKYAVWSLTRGRAVLHSYGGDKGLANLIVEPGFVALLTLLYFIGLRMAASSRQRRGLFMIVLAAAALLTLVVPPLPE